MVAGELGAAELVVKTHLALSGVNPVSALDVVLIQDAPVSTDTPAVRLEKEVALPGVLKAQLTPGPWWVLLKTEAAWARPVRVQVPDEGQSIELPVWPAGFAEGRLVAPTDGSLPGELKVRFETAPAEKIPVEGFERCPVDAAGTFRCKLPVARLDLRLRAEPYLSLYRWDVAVSRARPVRLGALRLERGASVVGWVVTHDGSPLKPEARVELRPAGMATPLADGKAPGSRVLATTAPVEGRGFFHFDGVAPGRYQLTARQAPFGEAQVEVTVLADLEAELRDPLILAPPETLAFQVEPVVDPDGEPWRLSLERLDPYRGRSEPVQNAEVGADGWWRHPGLARGRYILLLSSGTTRDVWLRREVDLGAEPMPLALVVEVVEVEGHVWLGEEPLAAQLLFGSRFGSEKRSLRSDSEGRFSGLLPRAGDWAVEIEADHPPVSRTLTRVPVEREGQNARATVDIQLPATKVRIAVVDARGRPAGRAMVEVLPAESQHPLGLQSHETDERGELFLAGLDEGLHDFRAFFRDGSQSGHEVATLTEGPNPTRVRLMVRPMHRVVGQVHGGRGAIPGARVTIFPQTMGSVADGRTLTTDAQGQFATEVPADTTHVGFWTDAPGFAFQMGTSPLPERGELQLDVHQDGGTLTLEAPAPPSLHGKFQPVLFHKGASISWFLLGRIARRQKGGEVSESQLRLPAMEPGPYRLCWVPVSSEAPGSGESLCAEAYLTPLGETTLGLPSPP